MTEHMDQNKIDDTVDGIMDLIESKDINIAEAVMVLVNLNAMICVNLNVCEQAEDVEKAICEVEGTLTIVNTCALSAAKTVIQRLFNERKTKDL